MNTSPFAHTPKGANGLKKHVAVFDKGQAHVASDGGPPEDLVAVGVSTSAINVSWSSPPFEPLYYLLSAPPCMFMEEIIFGLSFMITGLEPCQSCNIFVTSYYSDTTQYTNTILGATQSGGAADGAPDPPQNLRVFPQSEAIVLLIWDAPSDTTDLDHYYVYVEEDEDINGSTTATVYTFSNLVACTNYTFGVRSVSATYVMSDPLLGDGRTEDGPPPAPQNLEVDDYTSTTVTLSWGEPDTLCDIEDYRVKWVVDDTDAQSTRVTETSYTVIELSKSTTYTFSVSAFTSYGEGDEATVEQTTTEDDGGPPEDLVAVGVSASAINVSWSPPPYEPIYYLFTAPPCVFTEEICFDLSYMITGLDACDSCSVKVTSYYSDITQYDENTVGTSLPGDPPPPNSCSVEVEDDVVTVSWVAPPTKCQLGPYSVKYTWTKLWGDGEEGSDSKNTTAKQLRVNDPVPYSQYSFEISSSIDGVFGSPASCSGTSQETEPGPPVILTVDSVQGKALVTWETPVDENGVIVSYGILVDEETDPRMTVDGDEHSASVELDPCVSVGLSVKARNNAGWGPPSEMKDLTVVDDVLPDKTDCNAKDFRVEVCWDPYSSSCPVSQYNLEWEGDVLWSEDLEDSNTTTMEWSASRLCYNISALPYTEYHVQLSVGSGTDTIDCSAVTPMAAPGPPLNVKLTTTENFVLHVSWSEPEKKNGIIDIYQVEWTLSNGDFDSITTEDNNTFTAEILGLSCGVTADVTVRAKVEDVDDFGERSPSQTAYLVNSVDTLTCESSAPGQVYLNWTLEDANCNVTLYNITWTTESLWSDDTGQGFVVAEKDDDSLTVDSLLSYSSVSLQIHVDNSPEYTECSTVTPEEVSSPPTAVEQTANDTSSVTIEWGPPESIRGKLTEWHLIWTTVSSDPIGEASVPEANGTKYKIEGLSHSSTYAVSVMAVNGAGESDPRTVNASTSYISEPSNGNKGLIIGLSVGGGILLILLLVGGFIFYQTKQSTKPPRSAPHMPEVSDDDSDELYRMPHVSSVSQRFQNKIGSGDYGTNSELYTSPRPSLLKDEPVVADNAQPTSGQVFVAPAGRRFSGQASTSLPRLGAYNRRPSQQVNSRMRHFEEYNRRPSQQDLIGSGGPGKPNIGEFGRRPSQQVDLGSLNLKEYGRRPSQQANLGKPMLGEFGRRPSQQVDLGRPNMKEYGRRPSQQAPLGKPMLGEFGRRPSQQVDFGGPRSAEYERRRSQQIDIGRPMSREYARRPSQQLPSGGGSYPSRFPHEGAPRRSSADLYSRRPSQQADLGPTGDRMYMKRPSKQFVMSFEGIQEL